MDRQLTIIDYGMGNICSIQSAFEFLGASILFPVNNWRYLKSVGAKYTTKKHKQQPQERLDGSAPPTAAVA